MRVLSGIQPSGDLHIGNYFGRIKRMIERQDSSELYCFIANYHAMTSLSNGELLKANVLKAATDFLALGLSPDKSIFWVQSDMPEVLELYWILSNFTPMGLLERAHSYKDKTSKGIAANHGLFSYPVLMAADILIMSTQVVPVGKDQIQHVEMARDIAIKFNNEYGDIFTIPVASVDEELAVVPGIDGAKMSKSYENTIEIFCTEKALKQKIGKIVTDSTPLEEPKNPDTCNIYAIAKPFLTTAGQEELKDRYLRGGEGYGHFKQTLQKAIWEHFEPARLRRAELEERPDSVIDILKEGAKKAKQKAAPLMELVRQKQEYDMPISSCSSSQLNFNDIRRHYRFTDADRANLQKMVPIMTDWANEFTGRVVEFIKGFDDYNKYLPSEGAIRLHAESFEWWFVSLFTAEYDDAHLEKLFKIGLKHLEAGLPPHYVHATVAFVRDFINEKISMYFDDRKEREVIRSSCSKMLDMNLDIIAMSYREAELRPFLVSGKFQRWMIMSMEKFSLSMDVVLSFILVIIALVIVVDVVIDMINLLEGNVKADAAVMDVLGTLLILWAISELLQEGIKHLRGGGQFAVSSFVGVGLAAIIREILIASLNHDVKAVGVLTFTVLALGTVYYMLGRTNPKPKGV